MWFSERSLVAPFIYLNEGVCMLDKVKIKFSKNRRELLISFSIAFPLLGVYIFVIAPHLAINFSPSISGYLFWVEKGHRDFSPGDYVLIKFSKERHDPYIPNGYVGKRIGCMPGQVLERKGLAFYCDGKLVAVAKTRSISGKPLHPFEWTKGKVPEGYYFVYGEHPYSWDSRYYGFVSEKEIVAKEVKLF